ncbi:MAG: efflux RND transporter periplasmic adaptor subunit [Polyangia bacterium]
MNTRIPTPSLALLAVTWSCAGQAPPRTLPSSPPTRVQVAMADRSLGAVATEVVGTVHSAQEATIAPLVSGTVIEVRVGLGSFVRPGEVLVRLAARELDARREQARAVSALATRDRDRATVLKENGAITVAQYEAAQAHWGVARAQEAEASTVADRTVVRAPFAGMITAKLVNVGEAALPGRPLLTLESRAATRFEAQVPETTGEALALGDRLRVSVDGVGRELEGRVAEIRPSSDDATRSRLVKLDLPETPGLRSGQFGRLLLTTGRAVTVTVPSNTVVRRGQLETVFVVDSGIARLRLVRCGRESNGRTQISSGLSGGERLALLGTAELVDGQRVEESP